MWLISFLLDSGILDPLKRLESLLPKSLFPQKLLIFKYFRPQNLKHIQNALHNFKSFQDLQKLTNDCLTQVARQQTSNLQELSPQATWTFVYYLRQVNPLSVLKTYIAEV